MRRPGRGLRLSAGSTAAIAAARGGADTLLAREGRRSWAGRPPPSSTPSTASGRPGSDARKVVGGIADEVVGRLRALGPVVERPNTYGAGTGITYHPEHLRVVWADLRRGQGARVLLHAFVQDATVRDGRVTNVVVATKAGLGRVAARIVIDASGDADVCAYAGFGFEQAGEREPAQTLTTTFRMVNVDHERRRSITKDELHDRMAPGRRRGLRPAPARGQRPHHARRRDDRHRDDARPVHGARPRRHVVNATDPWFLTAGGDRRPAPGARVRPVPRRSRARATRTPRLARPRHPDRGARDAPRPRRRAA